MSLLSLQKVKLAVEKEGERANQFPRKVQNVTEKRVVEEAAVTETDGVSVSEPTRKRKRKANPKRVDRVHEV